MKANQRKRFVLLYIYEGEIVRIQESFSLSEMMKTSLGRKLFPKRELAAFKVWVNEAKVSDTYQLTPSRLILCVNE